MLHKMFAEARSDLRVRRPILSGTERAANQPPNLTEATGCLDSFDLECPYCSTVYMTEAGFCHRCGKRRRGFPKARSGSLSGSCRASKVRIGQDARHVFCEFEERRMVGPVNVGARGRKQPRGSARRVVSLSPEKGDAMWQFCTPERRAQSGESMIAKESSLDSSSGNKSMQAYIHCIESRLDSLRDENSRLLYQLEVDKVNNNQCQSQPREEKPRIVLAASDVAWAADLELASVVLHAWSRAVLRACCARWQLAEAAHTELRLEHAGLLKLKEASAKYTQDADVRLAQMEAQLSRVHRSLRQEEAQASESSRESALLQASALQVGQKVTALADQLSLTETRLGEARARLTLEEAEVQKLRVAASASHVTHNANRQLMVQKLSDTEALLAETRLKAITFESEAHEAHCETLAERALTLQKLSAENLETDVQRDETESYTMRTEIQALLAAQVETERRAAAAEVQNISVRAALQIAESESAHAREMEVAASRRANEAARWGSELASQLQLLEKERCNSEESADVVEASSGKRRCAELESNILRLQNAAFEADIARSSPAMGTVESRHIQEILAKANVVTQNATPHSAVTASTFLSTPEVKLVGNECAVEMEEAAVELRRWRMHGTPPRLEGSALQKSLSTRVDELQQQLGAAKAIRACGLRKAGAGNIVAAMAAAALAAARDAASLERIEALAAELADAQEVNAVVEGLMDDLRSVTNGNLFGDGNTEDLQHEGVQALSQNETFTSELLEALTNCRAELARARQ
eukprot:TRINITY_DN19413_c0_g1_i1.p1 TRINITY_DN19413_c0_g1~~TRINITY_DN19413_c0_g1_i1.p1  ORF type:complete len:763 (+),score=151.01 TRINITY_DN19413_c0_g1_i1:63-2351(+)